VDPVLYTTLDGPASVTSPTLGTGIGSSISTLPSNDFVAARVSGGLHTDSPGERAAFRQLDGAMQNVEMEHGTMELWYRPDYNHNDNLKYDIAGTGNWNAPGAWHLGKHNNSNQNSIFLIVHDANGTRYEHDVLVSNYSWKAGDWLLIRVTWDFNLPPGQQNMHLYVNGNELPLTGQVTRGTLPMPAEKSDELIHIGGRGIARGGSISARGLYDEVRIWNRVIPPT
jgi:hypothetical protein